MEVVASLKTPETASGKHQVLVPKGRSLIIYRTRQGHVTMELSAGFKVADRLVRRHLGDFFHVPDDQGIRQWIKKAFQRRTSNTKCAARILALFMPSSHGVEIPLVYNPSTFEPFVWIIMVSNSGWYFSSFWKLGTLIQATRLPGNKLLVPKVDTRRHVLICNVIHCCDLFMGTPRQENSNSERWFVWIWPPILRPGRKHLWSLLAYHHSM